MRQETKDTRKRLRPERGDGVDRREAAAPSESERGCPPPLVMGIRDQLRRGLAVARLGWFRAKAEGPASSEKSRQGLTIGMLLVCLALLAVSVLAQQPPQPPEGFVPAASVQGQEQLPAAPLVITAYSVVWLLVFGYLWSIWRRLARAERDVAEVTRRIAGAQRR